GSGARFPAGGGPALQCARCSSHPARGRGGSNGPAATWHPESPAKCKSIRGSFSLDRIRPPCPPYLNNAKLLAKMQRLLGNGKPGVLGQGRVTLPRSAS